jgi:hypothetical protein
VTENPVRNRKLLYILIPLSAVVILAVFGVSMQQGPFSFATATNENTPEVGSEEWVRSLEVREKDIFATALADQRVSAYTENAYTVNHDFTPHELRDSIFDELVIHTVNNKEVRGDWQTSYAHTWRGLTDIELTILDGNIHSINVIPKEDVTEIIEFTDDEKSIIRTTLDDQRVKNLIEGREGVHIRNLYHSTYFEKYWDCPPNNCTSVIITKENSKAAVVADVNTLSNKVIRVTTSGDW